MDDHKEVEENYPSGFNDDADVPGPVIEEAFNIEEILYSSIEENEAEQSETAFIDPQTIISNPPLVSRLVEVQSEQPIDVEKMLIVQQNILEFIDKKGIRKAVKILALGMNSELYDRDLESFRLIFYALLKFAKNKKSSVYTKASRLALIGIFRNFN
jgi:hypothetical protein